MENSIVDASIGHSKRKRSMSEKEDNNSRTHLDNRASKRKVIAEKRIELKKVIC